MNADLPTPLGPVTPTQAPGPTVSETPARTVRPPRVWVTPRATRVATGARTGADGEGEREVGTGDLRDRGMGHGNDGVSLHAPILPSRPGG